MAEDFAVEAATHRKLTVLLGSVLTGGWPHDVLCESSTAVPLLRNERGSPAFLACGLVLALGCSRAAWFSLVGTESTIPLPYIV